MDRGAWRTTVHRIVKSWTRLKWLSTGTELHDLHKLSYLKKEKAMAPHSSTLAWKIPWMEEPSRLQSMGSLRVGHDWTTSLSCIGEGNGNPLQCSCLENPRDGGAWWAAVYGVAQSRTRLKWLSSSSSSYLKLKVVVAILVHGHVRLFWDLMYCNPPGSSLHGISLARILEWVAISISKGFSQPRGRSCISCTSCIGRKILYHWAIRKSYNLNLGYVDYMKLYLSIVWEEELRCGILMNSYSREVIWAVIRHVILLCTHQTAIK